MTTTTKITGNAMSTADAKDAISLFKAFSRPRPEEASDV